MTFSYLINKRSAVELTTVRPTALITALLTMLFALVQSNPAIAAESTAPRAAPELHLTAEQHRAFRAAARAYADNLGEEGFSIGPTPPSTSQITVYFPYLEYAQGFFSSARAKCSSDAAMLVWSCEPQEPQRYFLMDDWKIDLHGDISKIEVMKVVSALMRMGPGDFERLEMDPGPDPAPVITKLLSVEKSAENGVEKTSGRIYANLELSDERFWGWRLELAPGACALDQCKL
ncbi:MAG: hypothetical protein NWP69_00925, partial [Congregibacter sp.]|nr:hypothetical protein [Congregibacter sp.]